MYWARFETSFRQPGCLKIITCHGQKHNCCKRKSICCAVELSSFIVTLSHPNGFRTWMARNLRTDSAKSRMLNRNVIKGQLNKVVTCHSWASFEADFTTFTRRGFLRRSQTRLKRFMSIHDELTWWRRMSISSVVALGLRWIGTWACNSTFRLRSSTGFTPEWNASLSEETCCCIEECSGVTSSSMARLSRYWSPCVFGTS